MDWLSLFLVLMLGALAYVQSLHGFFSALIMTVCVMVCSVLSFATFEWVAMTYLLDPLGDMSLPVAFIGMFVIPLIVIRLTLDHFVTRSMLLPSILDKAGAIVCGAGSSFLMTGMLVLTFWMTPFGGSILGHEPMDTEKDEVNAIWLSPDELTVTFCNMMSKGVFSGRASFSETHPDFVEHLVWNQTAPNELRHVIPEEAIRVVEVEEPLYIYEKTRNKQTRQDDYSDPIKPESGRMWYAVRFALGATAKDNSERIRFTRHQVRLVGRPRPGGPLKNYAPVAIEDDKKPERSVKMKDGTIYTPSTGTEVFLVFDVETEFDPEFIEYGFGARVSLSGESVADPGDEVTPVETPVPAKTASTGSQSENSSRRGGGGRVSGVRTSGNSRFGEDLPIAMTEYQKFDFEESRNALANGHIYGSTSAQNSSGSQPRLARFDVPKDKRLFHLEVEQLRARSGIGKVLSFAITTAQQYTIRDENGKVYPVVGQYAIADVNGDEYIEIQYYPAAVAVSNRGGIRKFNRIKKRELDGAGTRLVYLFLLDPGVRVKEFSTGRGATDLSDLNLAAPN